MKVEIKYAEYRDSEYTSLHRIARRIPKSARVLDVGCATGYLGKLLKEKDCALYGIEGNPDAAAVAAKEYQKVFVVDLDACDALNGDLPRVDVLVFGDILEHLRKPEVLLKRLRASLVEGGYALISVPNVANWSMRFHLLRGKFDYVRYGVLDESHLRFFTLDSARQMICDAGFEIREIDFTPGLDKLVPYRKMVHRFLEGFEVYLRFADRMTRRFPRLFAHQLIFIAQKGAS